MDPALDGDGLTDATTGQRFLTFILDYVGTAALSFCVGMVMVVAGQEALLDDIPDYLFGVLFMLLYYVGFEATLGRTPGKMIAGTRVVTTQGGQPSLGQILGRTLARFVPFEAFSAFGGGQMWHDSWSSTRVITTR